MTNGAPNPSAALSVGLPCNRLYLRHPIGRHVSHDIEEAFRDEPFAAPEQQRDRTRWLELLIVFADLVECTQHVGAATDVAAEARTRDRVARTRTAAVNSRGDRLGLDGGKPTLQARGERVVRLSQQVSQRR